MKYVSFKGLKAPWSKITLGTWQLAQSGGWGDNCSASEADAIVKAALDAGITAFDTAEGYGDGEAESRLGKALGSKKDEVIIISKIWPDAELTEQSYLQRLDGTLKALGRDYVDVYLVHFPVDHFNSKEKSQKLADILGRLKASGKTLHVGLSNFHKIDLELLEPHLSLFATNQVPYNMLEREYEGATRTICENNDIPYMAYSPNCKGLLAHRIAPEDLNFSTRARDELFQEPLYSKAVKVYEVVEGISRELGVCPANVAMAWVLAQKNILTAILGTRKHKQVKDSALAGDLELSKEHLALLNKASDEFCQSKF